MVKGLSFFIDSPEAHMCYILYALGILTSKSVTPKSTLSCDNSVDTCPR
ncbi:hypothetical protein ALT1644_720005 [Alteromonas macleodii]